MQVDMRLIRGKGRGCNTIRCPILYRFPKISASNGYVSKAARDDPGRTAVSPQRTTEKKRRKDRGTGRTNPPADAAYRAGTRLNLPRHMAGQGHKEVTICGPLEWSEVPEMEP